ncbi:MAG: DUF4330 domain-containing protein [Clostridia bacterium]|nr:DUF4330 domain-containing protein [Clostridia bacterium]
MKLIDEKGKLFGKLNIVDLVVVVLIAAIAAAVVVRFTSSKLNANGLTPASEDQYCYVTAFASLQVPEVADALKAGDHIAAGGKFTDAEIVDVKVEPAAYIGVNSEGKAVYSEHPLWKDVTVVIKEKIDPSNITIKVGGQEARVGYSYIVKTQTVEANAKIRGIEFKAE